MLDARDTGTAVNEIYFACFNNSPEEKKEEKREQKTKKRKNEKNGQMFLTQKGGRSIYIYRLPKVGVMKKIK